MDARRGRKWTGWHGPDRYDVILSSRRDLRFDDVLLTVYVPFTDRPFVANVKPPFPSTVTQLVVRFVVTMKADPATGRLILRAEV